MDMRNCDGCGKEFDFDAGGLSCGKVLVCSDGCAKKGAASRGNAYAIHDKTNKIVDTDAIGIREMDDNLDFLLRDLETKPSRTHNLFKRVLKKIYEERKENPERFFDECAAYLVSITARARDGSFMRDLRGEGE